MRKKGKNAKRLFNEYVAGKLATEFGLSRPATSLIRITECVRCNLDDSLFDLNCPIGAATEYVEGLQAIPHPKIPYEHPDFPEANRKHLIRVFGGESQFDQFYAMHIFSCWMFLKDKHKYENLRITPDRSPVFLDFDFAFGGTGWEELNNQTYDWVKMLRISPYLRGVTTDPNLFEPWIERLLKLKEHLFIEFLTELPSEWEIPGNFIRNLRDLLFGKRRNFIDEFRLSVEFRENRPE